MPTTTPEFRLAVTADNRQSMDFKIDEAVAIALDSAMREQRRGILVTRAGPAAFTIELSDDVPFGLTREHQAW